ncbi:MAG: ATP/GTP-binding protein [Balneolales bacterium]
MLIQFIVENFKSFREETILNMVAGPYSDHENHIYEFKDGKEGKLLRSSALYGANASGKTNLVEALLFARNLITDGTIGEQRINVQPFKLSEKSKNKPSRFEFVIKQEDVIYHYGFIVNHTKVLEEWLFATPNKKEVKYFERFDSDSNRIRLSIGTNLAVRGSKAGKVLDLIAETTRSNQLFLKEAYEKNVEKLKPVYDWFDSVLTVIPVVSEYTPLELRAFSDENFTEFLSSFLSKADTGIESIQAHSTDMNLDDHFSDLPVKLREDIKERVNSGGSVVFNYTDRRKYAVLNNDDGDMVAISLKARHRMDNDKFIDFEIYEESDGTQRLLNMLPALADMGQANKVCFIDELDRRMHTQLTRHFLEYYFNKCGNNNQLIFTTHDTNLLDSDLLRRDEIWFIEKGNTEVSNLYSLSDYKPRNDLNLSKSYLQGRFGAIPYIKSEPV